MLPDMDGLDVLRALHAAWPALPVLFLTARDAEEDREAGLGAGADAYLTKPFSLADVVSHLRVVLGEPAADTLVRVAGLELDPTARIVRRGGATIPLTAPETRVLWHLAENAGRDVPTGELGAHLPGGHPHVVALCLVALGRKLGPVIETVDGGRAYRLPA
jgi:two-component system, OmpR family, response regulator